jgi:hypothetical protein
MQLIATIPQASRGRGAKLLVAWTVLILVGLVQDRALGQVGIEPELSGNVSLYDRVVARVFKSERKSAPDEVFVLSVVFRPSAAPESQIVIRQGRKSSGTIELLIAAQRVQDILDSAIRKGEELDPEILAKRVTVTRREIAVSSSRSFGWQNAFLSSVRGAAEELLQAAKTLYDRGVTEVTLDGESYDICYQQGLNRLAGHVSESGAITDWAEDLKKDIRTIANTQ